MSFKRLDPSDVLVSVETATAPVWSTKSNTLTTFFTNPAQSALTLDYFTDVYQATPGTDGAEVQFSIAYADFTGGGGVDINALVPGNSPTKVNYSTYRNLILGDKSVNSKVPFSLDGGVELDYFYVINISRARYKERLLPSSFSLILSDGAATLTLTPSIPNTPVYCDAGRYYKLTGVNTGGTLNTATVGEYGILLPDVGVILLNGPALDLAPAAGGLTLGTVRTANTAGNNPTKLFTTISTGASFKLNSEESLSSNFVFVRARNGEFNYTTNPSYITGSGDVKYDYLIDNPAVYATGVGLYNDNNELLAVAKLSRPLLKTSTRETLVRLKLDY